MTSFNVRFHPSGLSPRFFFLVRNLVSLEEREGRHFQLKP